MGIIFHSEEALKDLLHREEKIILLVKTMYVSSSFQLINVFFAKNKENALTPLLYRSPEVFVRASLEVFLTKEELKNPFLTGDLKIFSFMEKAIKDFVQSVPYGRP